MMEEPDGVMRPKGARFCRILQSSVIPRLKLDDQMLLLLLIKLRRRLRSIWRFTIKRKESRKDYET